MRHPRRREGHHLGGTRFERQHYAHEHPESDRARGGGFTLWFTGLSGSGKTTIAHLVGPALDERGHVVEYLDGDTIRTHLSKGLGFSKEDRDTNIERIGWVASRITRHGGTAITAAISPYVETRQKARDMVEPFGPFVEVYVKASVEECARRDVNGLYAKAFAGEIKGFTGVDDPYEEPESPEIVVDTETQTPEESAADHRAAPRRARAHRSRGERMSAVTTDQLIRPHGGVLVERTGARPDDLDSLEVITLSSRELADLDMLASGALSPLTGFMGREDYEGVVESMQLANGLRWAWLRVRARVTAPPHAALRDRVAGSLRAAVNGRSPAAAPAAWSSWVRGTARSHRCSGLPERRRGHGDEPRQRRCRPATVLGRHRGRRRGRPGRGVGVPHVVAFRPPVCISVLHHIPDYLRSVERLANVLAPGGHVRLLARPDLVPVDVPPGADAQHRLVLRLADRAGRSPPGCSDEGPSPTGPLG